MAEHAFSAARKLGHKVIYAGEKKKRRRGKRRIKSWERGKRQATKKETNAAFTESVARETAPLDTCMRRLQ